MDGISGYLFEPGDIQSMAQACIALVDNPVARREMGKAGQEFAHQQFDLKQMIVDIEMLYEELLQKDRQKQR